jgi:DNA-binding LacI/PurR family transcriptional regulator
MKTKRQPLYSQIKSYLYRLIYENINNSNFVLPSEYSLANSFNISRITSKRALDELRDEGLVIRSKGIGTKIALGITKSNLEPFISNENTVTEPVIYDQQNKIIAIILPDLKSKYYMELLNGVSDCVSKYNWNILFQITNYNQQTEEKIIKNISHRCNGLIISPINNKVYNKEILKLSLKNFPLVLIDNELYGIETNVVSSDNFTAIYEAAEYFIKLGKKNIGLISQAESHNMTLDRRKKGYQSALDNYNIEFKKNFVLNTLEHYDTEANNKLHDFFESNIELEGVIALNYETGIKVLSYIVENKTSLTTNDVIIFDEEFKDIENLLKININYIKQDAYQIGYKAAETIIEQNKNINNLHKFVKIPTKLMINTKLK